MRIKPHTPQEEAHIRHQYLAKPVSVLAKELSWSSSRLNLFLHRHSLIIPDKIKRKRMLDSRIKVGSTPFNKGLKQTEFMSAASIKKTESTRFKKGCKPHNQLPDDTVVLRGEGTSDCYYYKKVGNGCWVPHHVYMWEQDNGLVPLGWVVSFKDGNTLNVVKTNLELITKREVMYRNSVHNYPKEIIPSLMLIKDLETEIKTKLNPQKNG